ncbi:pilus assembly protein PilB [Leptolyngbya sp. 'hensonii']|uniref:ATP-binding protein n=1 Tax=Leptolyngbya sp. 'hensonii' TaxID=1922337 RepID=UPI00094FB990|nr:ATP-binding protein [Leptolyngbya sp. 'hensonii']OLP17701.1 pilus assembly protein PilB [Leptolyngbya sp. 'hensonii']
MSDRLTQIYNAFDPSRPLPAGDPQYVDFRDVRGDEDIVSDLGKRIRNSNQATYQLYTGHRGSGKSTELRRLQQSLEEYGFFVVYFEADEEDIDPQNVEYIDILLACTRRFLKEIRSANAAPIQNWLRDRWQDLKDLAQMEISIDDVSLEQSLSVFTKLTASIRAEPTQRAKIRERVNPHTITLLQALNEFIADARQHLPQGKSKLAMIVDNLDRIPIDFRDNGRSNHEEIFLDRSEQLKGLNCHMVYTVPIALVYSRWANEVQTIYDKTLVLPMVMVQQHTGEVFPPGLAKLREAVWLRVNPHAPDLDLATQVFDAPETLERLCLSCGGHIRELMQMMQEAVNRADQVPITAREVQRAITELRAVYQRAVEEPEWEKLAQVAHTRIIPNDNEHRSLLQRRCILEYRCLDEVGELLTWYDIHPLIRKLPRFQEELAKLNP